MTREEASCILEKVTAIAVLIEAGGGGGAYDPANVAITGGTIQDVTINSPTINDAAINSPTITAPTVTGGLIVDTIELGHPTDTTLARVSAGVVSIEGQNILTAATGQPINANLTSWGAITRASGFDTFTATPSLANFGSLLTGEGTGVITALGVNVGSAGAFITFNGNAGTPSALVGTNITGTAAGLTAGAASAVAVGGITGLGSGVATWMATPSIANFFTALTGEGTGVAAALAINTGTAGSFVVQNGALGTPSSGTLTSATGLPISTGLTGAGTGILAALAVNIGSAGAPVLFNGAGGTPSSLTLTNATGLPNASVIGLGTMATQNANAVNITGGSIVGLTAGALEVGSSAFALTNLYGGSGNASKAGVFVNTTANKHANLVIQGSSTAGQVSAIQFISGVAGAAAGFIYSVNNGAMGLVNQVVAADLIFATNAAGPVQINNLTMKSTGVTEVGVAGSVVGKLSFMNATSGSITLQPTTGALGTITQTFPAVTGNVVIDAATQTLTNKRMTERVTSVASSATPTPNCDNEDLYDLTALAAAAAFQAVGGTPTNYQPLTIRIKDNGTARALTWDAVYVACGVALPSTTVLSKIMVLHFRYNTANSLNKWQLLAVAQEA